MKICKLSSAHSIFIGVFLESIIETENRDKTEIIISMAIKTLKLPPNGFKCRKHVEIRQFRLFFRFHFLFSKKPNGTAMPSLVVTFPDGQHIT